jgi:hypothetical protein
MALEYASRLRAALELSISGVAMYHLQFAEDEPELNLLFVDIFNIDGQRKRSFLARSTVSSKPFSRELDFGS